MLVKIHKSYRDIVAICDSELLGRRFEEGERVLDVKEGFFGGEEVGEDWLEGLILKFSKEDATFNIVGEKSIQTALKTGIINKEGIKTVQGIPFALVLL